MVILASMPYRQVGELIPALQRSQALAIPDGSKPGDLVDVTEAAPAPEPAEAE
jgi:hypothetical protein